jgi:membrane dipeptidase
MARNRKRRRWRDRLPGRQPETDFRWRGKEVSRLENLADAVFGFSVTLLVVAIEVPRDIMTLRNVIADFPAFIACFTLLMLFWNAHYRFFRRYGLVDSFTQITNYVILLLVLFAVYPLKFLFATAFAALFGIGSNGVSGLRSLDDLVFVFRTYGIGFTLTWSMFGLLYWHAWRQRARLDLSATERWLTRADLWGAALSAGVSMLSVGLTLITDNPYVLGFTYLLIPVAMTINFSWHGRRVRAARIQASVRDEPLSSFGEERLPQMTPLSDRARAVHQKLLTLDTHIDTSTASLLRPDWDFRARHAFADDHSQCDLPRMREGGIDALVFAIYVTQAARTPEGFRLAHEYAIRACERTHAVAAANAKGCRIVRTVDDARRAKAEGCHALFLSLENSYSLGRDAANVEKFHQLGVRMIGFTHMLHNDVADSSTDPREPEWGGLSPLGREIVAECNRLGVVLDASHASDDALRALLECSRAPVVLSHSGCRAVCNHPRNIGDDLLRALAARGGVIQLNTLPVAVLDDGNDAPRTAAITEMLLKLQSMVLTPEVQRWAGGEWDRIDREYPNPPATLDHFIRHIEHAVAVAGIDHVGIGCDFDGGGGVAGLNDVSEYPHLTHALLARGWSETDLAKLWGENTLRVFEAAAR